MPKRREITLTLGNFETYLNTAVLEKGQHYFEKGAVSDLAEHDKGIWNAVVAGSEDYHVEIKISDDIISECSCNCPHEVDYCKHIVAVFHAIIESDFEIRKKPGKKSALPQKAPTESFPDIVNNLSEKELRQFISEYGVNNPDFRDLFLANFSHKTNQNGKIIYTRLIKRAAKNAGDRSGFIDYYNAVKFVRVIDVLLEQATTELKNKKFTVVTDIAFAVIATVHEILKGMDDSGGGVGDCIRNGFELLIQLCTANIPLGLKERIFKEAAREAKDPKYNYVGFDEYWLDVLVHAAYNREKGEEVLQTLDVMLVSLRDNSDDWSKEFDTKRLLKHKFALLRRLDWAKEADALRLQFIHISEFRTEIIEECLAKKNYDKARKLIDEGIGIARKKDRPGIIHEYKKNLLRIAEEQNDMGAFRNIAKELYENGRHMEYYKIIKTTYSQQEWSFVAETFIEELQVQNRRVNGFYINDDSRLASIFIEEKYWDRLIQLVQGSTALHFIEHYSDLLKAKFPAELLMVYKEAIIKYAEQNTGRNHYIMIREKLKKIQKWEGGKEVVEQLLKQFILQYKARKAMLEELARLSI